MSLKLYNEIKKKDKLIEEKRISIKLIKQEKVVLHRKLDFMGNICEYLAIPLCAISIILVNLFSGIIIYVLPVLSAVAAIFAIIYKYLIRIKLDKLNFKIEILKKERKEAYYNREKAYEDIFGNLQNRDMDYENYYVQILKVSKECDFLTQKMEPYKVLKRKYSKTRKLISRLFDYILIPITSVVVPLLLSLIDISTISEIYIMIVSTAIILAVAIIDEKLTEKVDELEENINDIKSDRTVNYVRRDLKLNEALEFLKSINEIESMNVYQTN